MKDRDVNELGAEDQVSPPWGSIPSEAYLLQHWDAACAKTPRQQCRDLIRDYLRPEAQFGIQSQIEIRKPSESEIDTILRPWRNLEQRFVATHPYSIGNIWIRTCYDEGTDLKHDTLVEEIINISDVIDEQERMLDDGELYNFGDDWQQLFEVMPDLVVWQEPGIGLEKARIRKAEDEIVKIKALFSGETIDDPILIKMFRERNQALESEKNFLKIFRTGVQAKCVSNYVIIEDREALQSGKLLIAFVDNCGRVVRQGRDNVAGAEFIGGLWCEAAWDCVTPWEDGEVGADYTEDGVCGYLLHI